LDWHGNVIISNRAFPLYRELIYVGDGIAAYRPPGVGQLLRYAVGDEIFYFSFSEDNGYYQGVPFVAQPVEVPSSTADTLAGLAVFLVILFAGALVLLARHILFPPT
jgi:hypothetical protein